MSRRRLLELAAGVALVVVYFAFVPKRWYADHVPLWFRLPFGIVLAAVWLWMFVYLPVSARWPRRRRTTK